GAARGRAGGVAVEQVLADVEVDSAHLAGTEVERRLPGEVEIVVVVGAPHPGGEAGEPPQRPAIEAADRLRRDRVAGGIEVEEVREQVAHRVAHLEVALAELLEDRLGGPDVVAVVLARDPEPHDLRTVAVDQLLRIDVVAQPLADLAPLAVDDEAVGEHGAVGGAVARAHRAEQGGVEPAAVLVRALEVEVGGGAEKIAALQHRGEGDARIEPDVEDVLLLAEARAAAGAAALIAGEVGGGPGEPGVAALLLEEPRRALHHPRGDEGLVAPLAVEDRDRRAPGALAGDAPV